jgi:hypothetical protein
MAKKTSWYTFTTNEEGFTAHKYNEEGEHDADYTLKKVGSATYNCDCPAHVPFCRHKAMLMIFKEKGHIDSGWQYNHDTKQWKEPIKLDIEM